MVDPVVGDLAHLSVVEVAEQWHSLQHDIGAGLQLKPDPLYADADMMQQRPDQTHRAGIIQGLQDLGYLPEATGEAALSDFRFDSAQLDQALTQWRRDTRALTARYRPVDERRVAVGGRTLLSAQDLPLRDPLPVLSMQTAFDGELQLYRLPKVGEQSLLSRIFLFRLKTFNRYEDKAGVQAPLPASSLTTFRRLKNEIFGYAADLADVKFFNQLGNGLQLSTRFCELYGKRVFVYPAPDSDQPPKRDSGDRELAGFRIVYKQRTVISTRQIAAGKKVPVKKSVGPPLPVLSYRARPAAKRDFAAVYNTGVNTFGLELLQLRLWQQGYYTGVVDADWGPLSSLALDDYLGSCGLDASGKAQIRAPVQHGYALNLARLLRHLLPASERIANKIGTKQLFEVGDALLVPQDETQALGLKKRAADVLDEERQTVSPREVITRRQGNADNTFMTTQRRRRLNFSWSGVKSAIRGWYQRFTGAVSDAGAAIVKVAQRVRRAVLENVRSVVTVFRFALSRVRRAVRIAMAALQRFYYWIAGRPFGTGDPHTGHFVATRWSIDFDTVNICSRGCNRGLLERHLAGIAFMNAAFQFSVSVALSVLGVLSKIATGNWLRAAHAIYAALTELPVWHGKDNPYREYQAQWA